MTPVVIGPCTLYNADCRDVLPLLETGSVDAVVTDPPFGVRDEEWDSMGGREFARFTMSWIAEARRVAPEMVAFCTQESAIYDLSRLLWPRVRRLIWWKPPGSQYAGASESGLWFTYEVMLHCHDRQSWSVVAAKDAEVGRIIRHGRESLGMSRGGLEIAIRGKKTGLCYRWEEGACLPTPEQATKITDVLRLNGELSEALESAYNDRDATIAASRQKASENAAGDGDVFSFRTVTNGVHPCEKPVDLIDRLLQTIGRDYKTVLSPFMGSGTDGVACVRTGRTFIGIERDPAYFDIACRRIRAAVAAEKSSLFPAGETL